MSSVGQVAGGIIGGVIGFFAGGNVMLGASIGMAIGGYIDPPKGAHLYGPRLEDKQVQTSSYGEVVPDVFGNYALKGNVFWVENNALKETETTEGGGKGGGTPESTTYSYSATWAIAFCLGPVDAVSKIRIGSKLKYDAGAASLPEIIAQNAAAEGWKIYYGTDTQEADPRMAAALGAANCPAYRGICYIVFYDMELADYGNSLLGAQVEIEVCKKATPNNAMVQASAWEVELSKSFGFTEDVYETYTGSLTGGSSTTVKLIEADKYVSFIRDVNNAIPGGQFSHYTPGPWATGGSSPNIFINVGGTDYKYFDQATNPQSLSRLTLIENRYFGVTYDPNFAPRYKLVELGFSVDTSFIENELLLDSGEYAFVGEQLGSFITDNLITGATVRIRLYDYDLSMIEERTFTGAPQLYIVDGGTGWCSLFGASMWLRGRRLFVLSGISSDLHVIIFDLDTGDVEDRELDQPVIFDAAGVAMQVYPGDIVKLAGTWTTADTAIQTWVPGSPASGVTTLGEIVSSLSLKSRLTAGHIDVTELTDVVRGYAVTSAGSLRGAIEPLQQIWPFDAVQSGYKLKFVRRPHASVMTIPETDLGATTGGDMAHRFAEDREMDGQLPRRVSIRYRDIGREHDINTQYAERLNTSSVNHVTVDSTVVLTADEAAKVAEQLLFRAWVERSTYAFVLPLNANYAKLEATDVVTIETASATHEVLVRETNLLPNNLIEVKAVRNDAAVYSPTAVGSTGEFSPSTVDAFSKTAGVILDIPAIDSSMDEPCVLAAMRGYASWPGGTLFLSRNFGGTWVPIASAGAGQLADIGSCETALPNAATTAMVDTSGVLRVRMITGTLAGVTRADLLNGANGFAIGAPGRWEIVQAQNVTLVSADTYDLSNFLRGRFGTEWATGTHQIGDTVVALNTKLAWGRVKSSDFDIPYLWKFVTRNQLVDTVREESGTYTGVNLECLSPTKIKSHKTAAGDVVVSATRRARLDGEWRNYADVPVGEASEKYSGVIFTDSTYATIKREFNDLSTPTFTYTNAQQVADFGSSKNEYYIDFYQVSSLRGRGYPARKLIQFGDPYWSSVSVAVHCDGDNDSTILTDLTGRVWTHLGGNVKIKTAEYKFGGASAGNTIQSTGWSSPADAGVQPGSGNFSLSFWFKPYGGANSVPVWCGLLPSTPDWRSEFGGAGTAPYFFYRSAAGTEYSFGGAGTISANWAYYEWVRSGSNDYLFINGALVKTSAVSAAIRATPGSSIYFCGANGSLQFYGWADDFRFTNGIARNTVAYTPPDSPFPGA